MPKGNFSIDYVPPYGVLDEGEGLEDVGHDGVEEPVIVGVDLGHRLKICFIFFKIFGSPGLDIEDFLLSCTTWYWLYRCTEVPHR